MTGLGGHCPPDPVEGGQELLLQVVKRQSVSGEENYQTLLRSLFVFEYQDKQGRWFGINPLLAETDNF